MIVLYRFWPEAREQSRAAPEAADQAVMSPEALVLRAAVPALGAYDFAVVCDEPGTIAGAGSAALTIAEAIVSGGLHRDGGTLWCDRGPTPGIEPSPLAMEAFAPVPGDVPVLLYRAKRGWNLIAAPDQETWLTISMTFLNRRAYQRFDVDRGWHSPDVNELATLVLGTHHSVDVEGTCLTYGIPGVSLPDWADEYQAEQNGAAEPEATRSARLAESLEYAAILRGGEPLTGEPREYLRERLAGLGSDLYLA